MKDGARSRHGRFTTLDGFRGIAAIAVVFIHADMLWGTSTVDATQIAVDFFFLLSGYVIAFSYEPRFRSGELTFSRFALIRLIRLYPLYFAGLVLGASYFIARLALGHADRIPTHPPEWPSIMAFLMLPPVTSARSEYFALNPPAWSLFFEILSNIVYALIAPRLSTRSLIVIVATGLIALIVTGYGYENFNGGPDWHTFPIGLSRVWFFFFSGVLLGRLPQIPVDFGRWQKFLAVSLSATLTLLLVFGRRNLPLNLPIEVIVLPVLVLLGANAEPGRFLKPFFEKIGSSSYAIYAIHYPILLWMAAIAGRSGLARLGPTVAMLMSVAAAIIAAILLTDFFDVPVRRKLTQALLSKRDAIGDAPKAIISS